MLGKSLPNEKKLIEKCRDAIAEFDANEKYIQSSYQKLLDSHSSLESDIKKALVELNNVEISRYLLMKEGLSRLFLAQDLLIERLNETYTIILGQLDTIRYQSVLPEVLSMITMLNSDSHGGDDDTILANYQYMGEKLLDMIEFFKNLAAFVKIFINDLVDASRIYTKSTQKTLDKHGFSKAAAPGTNHMRAAAMAAVNLYSTLCADVLSSNESPSMRLVWEAIVRAFGGFAEMHSKLAELLTDRVSQPMDAILKDLEDNRKELNEKLSFHGKRVAAGHANVNRIHQKITKVKKDIHDRKSQVKKAREDESSISGNNAAAVYPTSGSNPASATSSDRAPSPPVEVSKMSSLRSTSLSAVVGLESASDRINRMESKITSLEEEEASLQESFENTRSGLTIIFESMKVELSTSLKTTSSAVIANVEKLRDSVGIFMDAEILSIEVRKKSLADARVCYESIDLDRDLQYTVKLIQTAAKAAEETNDEDLRSLDVIMADDLVLYQSDLIANERNQVKSRADSNVPVYELPSPSLANEEYAESVESILTADTNENLDLGSIYPDKSDLSSSEASSPVKGTSLTQSNKEDAQPAVEDQSSTTKATSVSSSIAVSPRESVGAAVSVVAPVSVKAVSTPSRIPSSQKYTTSPAVNDSLLSRSQGINSSSSPSISSNPPTASAVSSPATTKDVANEVSELNKFGLSSMDKVLESYSCALYPKKGMLTHGR
jgi:hypothetical protein